MGKRLTLGPRHSLVSSRGELQTNKNVWLKLYIVDTETRAIPCRPFDLYVDGSLPINNESLKTPIGGDYIAVI